MSKNYEPALLDRIHGIKAKTIFMTFATKEATPDVLYLRGVAPIALKKCMSIS